ncbi:MAG: M28 family peptidase [Opitutales bacterium]
MILESLLRLRRLGAILLLCSASSVAFAADADAIAEAVAADEAPRAFLRALVDDFGGRLPGTETHAAARARLVDELAALGLEPEVIPFPIPGWIRGADEVALLAPIERPVRSAALAYSEPHPPVEGPVVYIGRGGEEDYPAGELRGAIGLVAPNARHRSDQLAEIAADRGLTGLLFINRVGGGQVLARSGNFSGTPLAVPIYSITQEEGFWMQRLLADGQTVRLRLTTRSRSLPTEAANVRVRFPGRSSSTLVVGAHFDSWDLGQGAIDNGLGVAQLFALARALRGLDLHHSVELIWLDAEEIGLWGSLHQARLSADEPLVAMLNLDMVGVPIGVNALGADSLVPALERWHERRDEPLEKGVENLNWMASDHTPYQLAGVRSLTFNAPIRRESVRYYHDFADTWDKVHEGLIEESSAVIASLVVTLANDATLEAHRLEPAEIRALFERFNLLERLAAVGLEPAQKAGL